MTWTPEQELAIIVEMSAMGDKFLGDVQFRLKPGYETERRHRVPAAINYGRLAASNIRTWVYFINQDGEADCLLYESVEILSPLEVLALEAK